MIRLTVEPPSLFCLTGDQGSIDLVPTSVFYDPLSALADAVIALMKEQFTLESTVRVVCTWQDEPGEYRWVLIKEEDNLQISIMQYKETFSRQDDEEGKLLYVTECSAIKFTIQVRTLLRDRLDEQGPERYMALPRWPFPMQQYNTLQEIIRKEELNKKMQKVRRLLPPERHD